MNEKWLKRLWDSYVYEDLPTVPVPSLRNRKHALERANEIIQLGNNRIDHMRKTLYKLIDHAETSCTVVVVPEYRDGWENQTVRLLVDIKAAKLCSGDTVYVVNEDEEVYCSVRYKKFWITRDHKTFAKVEKSDLSEAPDRAHDLST